jgi:hypothetical protein
VFLFAYFRLLSDVDAVFCTRFKFKYYENCFSFHCHWVYGWKDEEKNTFFYEISLRFVHLANGAIHTARSIEMNNAPAHNTPLHLAWNDPTQKKMVMFFFCGPPVMTPV